MTVTKENRTIKSILDLKTGKEILASEFFLKEIDEIFQLRYEFETAIREETARYVCYYCKQPIKIRGRKDSKTILHFAHLKDSDECPIKTGNKFNKEEIQRIKYNGAKESELHFTLKNSIADFLTKNKESNKGIEEVAVEKVYKHKAIPKVWKKPDVSSVFKGNSLVFELQLSTTFLSVINSRQEFYKENNTFILWVFSSFDTNEEERKFTQSDIFYNNNFNGFEFNEETIELSKSQNDLVLKCFYQKPTIENNSINVYWRSEFVKLNELTFDKSNYGVYYYDFKTEKLKLETELTLSELLIINEIKNGEIQQISDLILNGYKISKIERTKIISLYNQKIKPIDIVDRFEKIINIVWAIIILKIQEPILIGRITRNSHLRSIVFDILSLKLKKKVGYAFTRQIQIAHSVFQTRPEYLDLYLEAIDYYQPNLLHEEDKSGKLRKRITKFRIENLPQNYDNNDIFEIMFPELMKNKKNDSLTKAICNAGYSG